MTTPGLLVGAARSSSGKTTLALGLMRALTRRGLRVAPVKCGPDYIDPAFHEAATRGEGVNLDSWTMSESLIAQLAGRVEENADIVIAEGAMGLFDGAPGGAAGIGSSADIAALLGWPVLLIHDLSGQGQTAAAVLRGLAIHDARLKIAGVVLNRVGSERHRKLAVGAIEAIPLPVLGALSRDDRLALPERHLGLVQASETKEIELHLETLADSIEASVDIDAVVASAGRTDPMRPARLASEKTEPIARASFIPPAQRLAVARDDAFSFFYPHLARAWRDAGAEIVFFSPLADEQPPEDTDFCWLPGGYPELHAGRLAQAKRFLQGLRRFAQTRPVHGECGGYMALGRTITDASGESHEMAGLLELQTSFAKRKLQLGYRLATLAADHPLGAKGDVFRGHEFHYATILREEGAAFAFARDAYSAEERPAGLAAGRVSGSFFHLIA